jgi:hypothetical protein
MTWLFCLVALGVGVHLFSFALTLVRLLARQPAFPRADLATTLILPLSGRAESLTDLLRALERQTLAPRRLIVAVESTSDPAHARAIAAMKTVALPIEIVVAGLATRQAQKCRNQQAALALLDDPDQAVVFLDGDILPAPWWLEALVAPLQAGTADIVTGLRWQQVTRHRLGTHLVCMIDRAAFLLPRFKARITQVVWGGSVAVTRRAIGSMQLQDYLARTLSDDLSIVDAAKQHGMRVLTRGELLVPTPASSGIAATWRFACRQYRIIHIYRPWLWRLAALAIAARLAGWAAILILALQHNALAWAAGGTILGLAMLRQVLTAVIAWRDGLPDPLPVTMLQIVLALAQPLVDLFHASIVAGAAQTRDITWGHVSYRVDGPYDVTVVRRTAVEGQAR